MTSFLSFDCHDLGLELSPLPQDLYVLWVYERTDAFQVEEFLPHCSQRVGFKQRRHLAISKRYIRCIARPFRRYSRSCILRVLS